MFGHDKTDDSTDSQVMIPTEPVQADADDNTELTLPMPEPSAADETTVTSDPTIADTEEPAEAAEPAAETETAPETADEPAEAAVEEAPEEDLGAVEAATASVSMGSSGGSSDLASLKEEALKELSPLVAHLDQPPEEKLKTIMRVYVATKDKALLKEAHDAAIALSDDTARAKALLDLIQTIDEATA